MEERTQAQIWEQSEDTVVRDAWLLAADFADEILRVDENEDIAGTDEWNAVVDKCLAEIARLA